MPSEAELSLAAVSQEAVTPGQRKPISGASKISDSGPIKINHRSNQSEKSSEAAGSMSTLHMFQQPKMTS